MSCQKDAIVSHPIQHTLTDLLTYAHCSFRWTETFPQTHTLHITTNQKKKKRSNSHFAIQNRKHVNEHPKQHTGQSMMFWKQNSHIIHARAQNIKETLRQQLSSTQISQVHPGTHLHGFSQLVSPSPTFHGCDH